MARDGASPRFLRVPCRNDDDDTSVVRERERERERARERERERAWNQAHYGTADWCVRFPPCRLIGRGGCQSPVCPGIRITCCFDGLSQRFFLRTVAVPDFFFTAKLKQSNSYVCIKHDLKLPFHVKTRKNMIYVVSVQRAELINELN